MTVDDLLSRVDMSGDCWVWTGSRTGAGYGQAYACIPVGIGSARAKTDRHCHRCDNPLCVNPDHLFLGTQHDNMLDKVRKGRGRGQANPTCRNGHEWSEANTYVWPGTLKRTCRICNREYQQRLRLARRARRTVSAA